METFPISDEDLPAGAARTQQEDQTEYRLSPEQWEAFCERLDAPPQTIPALRRLFDEPEPY